MTLSRLGLALVAVVLAGLGGCSSPSALETDWWSPGPAVHPGFTIPRPFVGHAVLFRLKDTSEASSLASACASLGAIPAVKALSVGPTFESGNERLDSSAHVVLFLAFEDEEGYAAYREHPHHAALVETWTPRLESIVVYDWVDGNAPGR